MYQFQRKKSNVKTNTKVITPIFLVCSFYLWKRISERKQYTLTYPLLSHKLISYPRVPFILSLFFRLFNCFFEFSDRLFQILAIGILYKTVPHRSESVSEKAPYVQNRAEKTPHPRYGVTHAMRTFAFLFAPLCRKPHESEKPPRLRACRQHCHSVSESRCAA